MAGLFGFLALLALIAAVTVAPAVLWIYGGKAQRWGLDRAPWLTRLIVVAAILGAVAGLFVSIKTIGPGCTVHMRMVTLPC